MAFAREKIREYFLEDKSFDYMMWLDDDIFLPERGIQRLLSYNKEQVGFYVHVYFEPDQVPCILKAGDIILGKGLQYFSFAEIDAYRDFVRRMGEPNGLTEQEKLMIPFIIKDPFHPQLFKPYAVNLGCLLVNRKVVEALPFRTHETFVMGEDLWYFNEANDKKFEFWCDSSHRCLHKNTEWDSIAKKGPKMNGGFQIAMGPNNATAVDIIDRRCQP
jgi:GT2 family glycosyltransferase